MKTTLSYEELIHSKKSILIGLKNKLDNIPNWAVSQKEKDDEIAETNKEIQEAKAEIIQLYKNLIIDCESELELLQPDYTKRLSYIALKAEYNSIKARRVMYINRYVYEKDLTEAHDKLTAYEAKHNINPENKEV